MLMTVTIEIGTKTEEKLRQIAKSKGQNLEFYLKQMAEREANLMPLSLSEAARPLYEWTEKQGYTEEELEDMIDEVVEEVRRETPLRSR